MHGEGLRTTVFGQPTARPSERPARPPRIRKLDLPASRTPLPRSGARDRSRAMGRDEGPARPKEYNFKRIARDGEAVEIRGVSTLLDLFLPPLPAASPSEAARRGPMMMARLRSPFPWLARVPSRSFTRLVLPPRDLKRATLLPRVCHAIPSSTLLFPASRQGRAARFRRCLRFADSLGPLGGNLGRASLSCSVVSDFLEFPRRALRSLLASESNAS